MYYVIIVSIVWVRHVHVLFIFVVSLIPGALFLSRKKGKKQQRICHGLRIKPCLVIWVGLDVGLESPWPICTLHFLMAAIISICYLIPYN